MRLFFLSPYTSNFSPVWSEACVAFSQHVRITLRKLLRTIRRLVRFILPRADCVNVIRWDPLDLIQFRKGKLREQ